VIEAHPEAARVARSAGRGSHTAMGVFSFGGNLGFAAAPLLVFGVVATGGLRWSPLLLLPAVAGAALCVPFSLHITLGQDYLPGRVGTAAGVTLGLAVSVGGVAGPLIGALADATALQTALAPLIALPALGCLLLRGLREPPGHRAGLPGNRTSIRRRAAR